jgi:uncharacterized protein YfaP (DUF2135 family)
MNGRLQFLPAAFAILTAFFSLADGQAQVRIETPRGGFSTEQTIRIKGSVQPPSLNRALLILNGIPQRIPVAGGRFDFRTVAAPGNNMVEIQAGGKSDRISFFARVPARDIKIVLTWDTASFTDLWVVDPKGEKAYWAHTSTSSGGNLFYNDADYSPQVFTMARALPGTYSIQVQYYASHGVPITRAKVYMVLYEGQAQEIRKTFQLHVTAPGKVYEISKFQMESR